MRIKHGGDIYTQEVQYDFSANINPLGMPESVKQALIAGIDDFCRYPDVNCTALRQEISKTEGVPAEWIVCGNGAADLIYRIVFAQKPKKALLLAPTFSEYEQALHQVNCEMQYYTLQEEAAFQVQPDFLECLQEDLSLVFLCNPNNPVGNLIDEALLFRIAEVCSQKNITLVLDACFFDFVPESARYPFPESSHCILLKAFTKIYAMAGLRLGYLICRDTALAAAIQEAGPCWNVSVPAQLAGIAALRETTYVEQTTSLIAQERCYLEQHLNRMGMVVYPSQSNFLLFRCACKDLDQRLLEQEQIAIRNCSNYHGLTSGFFRIAVRTHQENQCLIQAIERTMQQWQKQL